MSQRPSSRVSAAASGGGATFLSTSFSMSISILVALRSASADLSTSWATIASRLLIRRGRPSLSTVTGSFNAASNSAGRSFLRGPLGLPDRPFRKRVCSGGLPRPTRY